MIIIMKMIILRRFRPVNDNVLFERHLSSFSLKSIVLFIHKSRKSIYIYILHIHVFVVEK